MSAPVAADPCKVTDDASVFTRPAPRRRTRPARPDVAAPTEPDPAEPGPAEPDPAAPVPADPSGPAGPADPDDDVETPVEAVIVRIAGGRYAVEMAAVAEVGRPPRITRVPGVPSWVAGVANWRGRVLAVVDLRPLLGVPQAPLTTAGRLVVLSRDGVTVALLTEAVDGVTSVDPDRVEPAPVTLPMGTAALVHGHVTERDGPVVVLDVDAVFGLRSDVPRGRRTG